MRKIVILGVLSLGATATAQSSTQSVDCSTVGFFGNDAVEYTLTADFPEPSKTIIAEFGETRGNGTILLKKFNECGYTISSDGNMTIIKASNFAKLIDFFSVASERGKIQFAITGQGSWLCNINCDGKGGFNGGYFTDFFVSITPAMFEVGIPTVGEMAPYFIDREGYVVAYKIDGGPLKPLFFEGKVFPFKYPYTAKVIDFYAKGKYWYYTYDRVKLDLVNNSMTFYGEHSFPQK